MIIEQAATNGVTTIGELLSERESVRVVELSCQVGQGEEEEEESASLARNHVDRTPSIRPSAHRLPCCRAPRHDQANCRNIYGRVQKNGCVDTQSVARLVIACRLWNRQELSRIKLGIAASLSTLLVFNSLCNVRTRSTTDIVL